MSDSIMWHYTTKGEYSVKSGYHLAMASDEGSSNGMGCGFTLGFRKLWYMRSPNKIKIHCWKALFNALPVQVNLVSREIFGCSQCHTFSEDISHVFWCCKQERKVWKMIALWLLLENFTHSSFVDLFCWIVQYRQGKDLTNFCFVVLKFVISKKYTCF